MPDDEKKDEESIHKVDTVPPPPGEDDAYSAPTRVGEMPPEVLEAMRNAGITPQMRATGSMSAIAAALKAARVPTFVPAPDVPDDETDETDGDGADEQPSGSGPAVRSSGEVRAAPEVVSPVEAAADVEPAAPSSPRVASAVDPPLESPRAQFAREDAETAEELGDSSLDEIPRPYSGEDDDEEDQLATHMHPSAKPLPPVLGAGSIPSAPPLVPREALLILALVVALITLAVALGVRP